MSQGTRNVRMAVVLGIAAVAVYLTYVLMHALGGGA